MINSGYEMTADGFWIPKDENDKVVMWRVPVEKIENGDTMEDDYYFTLPEDLLERTGWKENDNLIWVDNKDGSFTLKQETIPVKMDEC